METNKVVLQSRLELIQFQRKYLSLQAENLGLQHALLGIEEAGLAKELAALSPTPREGSDVVIDEGPLKGTKLGQFHPNGTDS